MTPGARIAATIDILEKIEGAISPAEDIISAYLRRRRYIGSKDRRYITEVVYGVQRRQARLDWLTGINLPRIRVIANLFLVDRTSKTELMSIFSGDRYSPSNLIEQETSILKLFLCFHFRTLKLRNSKFGILTSPKCWNSEA